MPEPITREELEQLLAGVGKQYDKELEKRLRTEDQLDKLLALILRFGATYNISDPGTFVDGFALTEMAQVAEQVRKEVADACLV